MSVEKPVKVKAPKVVKVPVVSAFDDQFNQALKDSNNPELFHIKFSSAINNRKMSKEEALVFVIEWFSKQP